MADRDTNRLIEEAPSTSENPNSKAYGSIDNAPPTYAAADKAPPTYESLRKQIRENREQSESWFQFIWKIIVLVLCGTVGYVLIIGLMFLLPLAMIVMGSLYIHDCAAEPYIAVYLIVMGSFSLLLAVVNMIQRCRNRDSGDSEHLHDDEERADRLQPFEVLITCFLLGWFIAGNVWIYRTYNEYQWTDSTAADYCDHKFYLFSFWITTSIYMLFASLCCCGIMASFLTYCCCRE